MYKIIQTHDNQIKKSGYNTHTKHTKTLQHLSFRWMIGCIPIFVWFIDYPSKCCTFNISLHFLWSPCIPSPVSPWKFHIASHRIGWLWSISLMYGASFLIFRIVLSRWNRRHSTELVECFNLIKYHVSRRLTLLYWSCKIKKFG